MELRDFAPDPEQPRKTEFLDSPDEPIEALADYRRRLNAARARRAHQERIATQRLVLKLFLSLIAFLFLLALSAFNSKTLEAAHQAAEMADAQEFPIDVR